MVQSNVSTNQFDIPNKIHENTGAAHHPDQYAESAIGRLHSQQAPAKLLRAEKIRINIKHGAQQAELETHTLTPYMEIIQAVNVGKSDSQRSS